MTRDKFILYFVFIVAAAILVGVGLRIENPGCVAMGLFLGFVGLFLAIGEVGIVVRENNQMLKKIQEKLGIPEEKK